MVEKLGKNVVQHTTYCTDCGNDVGYYEEDAVKYEIHKYEMNGTYDIDICDFEYVICPHCMFNRPIYIRPEDNKQWFYSKINKYFGVKPGDFFVSKDKMNAFLKENWDQIGRHTREFQIDKLENVLPKSEWGLCE